jgi:hypothetical protein
MSNQIHSRQVAWFEAHQFRERIAGDVGERPVAGSPAWCALPDSDPRKVIALLDAGVFWCLDTDTEQEQRAEASRDVASAADWTAVARSVQQGRGSGYIARKAS